MNIQLQGAWEPLRVAEMLKACADECVYGAAWANDCASRIMHQVAARKGMTGGDYDVKRTVAGVRVA